MKILRKLRDRGDDLGLEYLGLENGGKHYRALFKNTEGVTHGVTISKTKDEPHKAVERKVMKQLEDLSAGNYQNLRTR